MIYILGAGGFGREVLNIFSDLNRSNEVVAFLEENCQSPGRIINEIPVYDTDILTKTEKVQPKLVGAIGSPLRKRLIEKTINLGYQYETIIHPNVIKSKWLTLGNGLIICAGTILTNQINVGNYSIINLSCTIGHDVTIGNYVTISPGVHISGNVSIGDGCFIGTGVSIVDRVRIGHNTYVGAGAIVTGDIPNNVLAVGIPAKAIRALDNTQWERIL
jgi:sugar O-acyltransferase (sialic acid O-acetyltransferase NeuD family)